MKTHNGEHFSAGIIAVALGLLFLIGPTSSLFLDEFNVLAFAQDDEMKMRISIILVKTKPEAQRILQHLQAGVEFAELARKYSIGSGKDEEGDLGYFAPGEMSEQLADVAANLKVGEYSGVVETGEGYLILMKTDEKSSSELSSLETEQQLSFEAHYERG